METEDSQIVREYLEGNDEVLAKLVGKYTDNVYNFIYRITGDREVSDDLTQDVFIKAWKSLKHFDQAKNFKTWLFTIARNTSIDWLRKKKSLTFSRLSNEEDDFSESIVDEELLPDEIFDIKGLAQKLGAALEKIDPEDRMVILLHNNEDMAFREIGEVIGKPMNTVKSRYRRAMANLREILLNQK